MFISFGSSVTFISNPVHSSENRLLIVYANILALSIKTQTQLEKFKSECQRYLAYDNAGLLAYLAPSRINLDITMERWQKVKFHNTREHTYDVKSHS